VEGTRQFSKLHRNKGDTCFQEVVEPQDPNLTLKFPSVPRVWTAPGVALGGRAEVGLDSEVWCSKLSSISLFHPEVYL
jgi:hypothetical protein